MFPENAREEKESDWILIMLLGCFNNGPWNMESLLDYQESDNAFHYHCRKIPVDGFSVNS